MDFDFAACLARLDPTYEYQIDKLAGGVVNVTARATKVGFASTSARLPIPQRHENLKMGDGDLEPGHGRFADQKTLILKHAPPFIAGVGTDAPMSQERQMIEAAALRLFLPVSARGKGSPPTSDECDAAPLHWILVESGVMVPTLLHYDHGNHILVISDLGRLSDMSQVFIHLGGFTPGSSSAALKAPTCAPRLGCPLEALEIQSYRDTGEKLGSFFARLHDPGTHRAITETGLLPSQDVGRDDPVAAHVFPSLPELKSFVHHHAIKPLLSQLLKFPSLLDDAEAAVLFAAVEADFLRTCPPEEQCFVLGDCWTGAVLLDLRPGIGPVGVAVIDWEFSNTTGRGVNGDVSQFLAHLECLRVAALTRKVQLVGGHLSAVNGIVEGFVQKYRTMQTKRFDDRIMRSAYLSHGAEIINCAFWKTWVCEDLQCVFCTREAGSVPEPETQCILITKLVDRGLSFLRAAVAEDPYAMTAQLRQGISTSESEGAQLAGLYDFFERP
ncbi:hypothetical protein G647_03766 [Cladophialophora carrionii CBS 160.54]|uniref:Aminoglycoside phosphotransferase domain-containing protein n=1 Tax=Cladophialophora carrionii CBS 160.54 TaxID=1279043 RepID=V9DEP0_9EURO|nr:uncharacterized protein G647_03766 [Cladophialophora carrionii CBS 160.54]ETI24397.1 hypothetical protein G647_03766 [Cladophialophora carrionii CBS 160.54]